MVVLNDVIDAGHIALLRERMLADAQRLAGETDLPFQFTHGHIQHDPPPFPPYLFRDVLANDLVIDVTRGILGDGLTNSFYSGNTALPGSPEQPVHADMGQLWPELQHPHPAYALVVNVPVVDVSPHNASTELWPGTHVVPVVAVQDGSLRVSGAAQERRRALAPPLQPCVRAGSVLIRDIRLWHRGMPNHSEQPRPMIAMIHWVQWWHRHDPIVLPCGTQDLVAHDRLTTHAVFQDEPIDYLHRHAAYDLQPATA